ncbi:hypothetical protein LTR66_013340 [Elasticomyces elasticus]|nr:hypothetical protein LTR66_013340 [Elasticomyces elasticus]
MRTASHLAASLTSKHQAPSPGIRFTFVLYENQRRWLGIGWTSSMLAYERAAWTDEYLDPACPPDSFQLPDVEGGLARWRWVEDSKWQVECTPAVASPKTSGKNKGKGKEGEADGGDDGWVYYDGKWHDGRRGQDGWGRYTRRRKWYRDAELVEVTSSTEITPSPTPKPRDPPSLRQSSLSSQDVANGTTAPPALPPRDPPPSYSPIADATDGLRYDRNGNMTSDAANTYKKSRFGRDRGDSRTPSITSGNSHSGSSETRASRTVDEEDVHTPGLRLRERDDEWSRVLGDDARMELG